MWKAATGFGERAEQDTESHDFAGELMQTVSVSQTMLNELLFFHPFIVTPVHK